MPAPHPPGRHFGSLRNDPQIRASIARGSASGFNSRTTAIWGLAQTLGLEPADLYQFDGIADLA